MAPPDPTDPIGPAELSAPPSAEASAEASAEPGEPAEPERKVRELLDAKTFAELERWFGLPSFQELADKGKAPPPEEDPEIEAVRARRAKAIAAVDPGLLEAHRRRLEHYESVEGFQSKIDSRIDPSIARVDYGQIERQQSIAEPREVEIPEPLRDDLADCTPQAILRDLHRPELYFDKIFEIVDMAAEQRLDIVAAVAEAMRTNWGLPPFGVSLAVEGRTLLAELRVARMESITHALPHFPNRRVTEP